MTLSPQFLDELRARTTLSTLVAKSVKLTRAGREHKGCCPFHQEKTPSFYVNDEKGFYHCFGCSAHGDAIRWLTEHRGLPFMEAVKELADAAGLDLPAPDPRAAARAERARGLHEAMAAAAQWFTEQLGGIEGADARALLDKRRIRPETARAFGLGFAPDARGRLRAALRDYGDAMLVEAGLLIAAEDRDPYDRFRGRLMIPIRDARGRVIAFGGRIIGQGEPKYLNSPDTPLFDKGRQLYNLDRASAAARRAGRLIVVEGYMDAIALAQAGIEEVVAPLGTAITETQLALLWRMVDVPILCLDGDAAGQKAAIRAATRALPLLAPGRSLSFATLPAGKDPDDIVRGGGAAAIEPLLAAAEPLVERLWAHELAALPLTTPEARAGLRARLGDHAQAIGHPGVRAEYGSEFRRRFDAHFAPPPRRFERRAPGTRWTPPPPPVTAEARALGAAGMDPFLARAVIAGLLRYPEEAAVSAERIAALRPTTPSHAALVELLLDAALDSTPLDSARLRAILAEHGFDQLAETLLRADARSYSFTRPDALPERARADLREAIDILVAEPEVSAALADATARMIDHWTDDAFGQQQALRRARDELRARLAKLGQSNEDG